MCVLSRSHIALSPAHTQDAVKQIQKGYDDPGLTAPIAGAHAAADGTGTA